MKPAIRITNVSKLYRLGELQHHWTIGDKLAALFSRRGPETNGNGHRARNGAGHEDEIWALKDVSFDVAPGEVVGIIGRNGAGKSTLLKILSRITEPTTGQIELHGRVSSLLEVGTGFHPELTGRDNIYLNGSVLGMKKAEIDRKFDEIVDFSGVEKFLDTPVKRYSSGMQVRLAFAVAAHLEPEVLIVDEVLAVGDAEFQRKCLGKMSEVATGGRTVLFVSHNMAAVESLCTKGVLLNEGCVEAICPSEEAIRLYTSVGSSHLEGDVNLAVFKNRDTEQTVLERLRILDNCDYPTAKIRLGTDFTFEVLGSTVYPLEGIWLNIRIDSTSGQRIAACPTRYQYAERVRLHGPFSFRCTIRNVRLMPNTYHVSLILKSTMGIVETLGPVPFEIVTADVFNTGRPPERQTGTYVPDAVWYIDSRVAANTQGEAARSS